uniref:Tubulinspecific chaperone C putative n=1 Tax=Albugo laibachii Nc14 TaxID=890382 RepID=F0W9G1_9STRA|nr:tubulinspecific chaperone C putative [Albugo laibachii Nc14]|eukprot:CCA17775.1 tubulinspecific chaperone C putative [Albugo laibachii Nc14]
MPETDRYSVGRRCEVLTNKPSKSRLRASIRRYGVIAYTGPVSSLPEGVWIGVRLDQASGRNDGTAEGIRYFDCHDCHGIFVRPENIRFIEDDDSPSSFPQRCDSQKATESNSSKPQSRAGCAQEFWKEFNAKEIRIRQNIDICIEKSGSNQATFEKLMSLVADMKEAAARAASLYLSPYDIRQTNLILTRIIELIEKARTIFAPRKQFTFRTARRKRTERIAIKEAKNNKANEVNAKIEVSKTDNHSETFISENELTISDKQDEVIFLDESTFSLYNDSEVPQDRNIMKDLNLTRLKNCTICITVETSAIRAHDLDNCRLLIGPVYGSIWLHQCHKSTFVIACRQLRVHWSVGCTFLVRLSSHPIIENCTQMIFRPYNLHYDGLKEALHRISLEKENGFWAKVNDFNWHRSQQSPNWSLQWDSKQQNQIKQLVPSSLASRVCLR